MNAERKVRVTTTYDFLRGTIPPTPTESSVTLMLAAVVWVIGEDIIDALGAAKEKKDK